MLPFVNVVSVVLGVLLGNLFQTLTLLWQRRQRRETLLVAFASDALALAQFIRMENYVDRYRFSAEQDRGFIVIDATQDYFGLFKALGSQLGELKPEHAARIRNFYFWSMIALDTARPDSLHVANTRNGLFMANICQMLIDLSDEIADLPRQRVVRWSPSPKPE